MAHGFSNSWKQFFHHHRYCVTLLVLLFGIPGVSVLIIRNYTFKSLIMVSVGETGVRSVMGHIPSVGFSRKLSIIGTLLLHKICLYLLGMVWYYQKIDIPMTRFVKIRKVCFCHGNSNFLEWTKYYFVTV